MPLASIAISASVGGIAGACAALYSSRITTMASIRQETSSNSPYNLYSMHVSYPYSIKRIISRGLDGNQKGIDSILREAAPLLPVHIEAPNFGCSAFALSSSEYALMGRSYDFRFNTSAMLVHCSPKDGYESIAFCALDNLNANQPLSSVKNRMACLAAPFVCLDGINERGVSIAVLTLDSKPTHHATGKPVISTSMAIRMVLDFAGTTQEAVDLLLSYDMFASSGRDYHFYITDATGDGRVVEYDCDSPDRTPTVTPTRQVTNFFAMHQEKVSPNQKNGHYGHGRERHDAIEETFNSAPQPTDACEAKNLAWQALKAASQEPNPNDVTSNTQWSIVFDNKNASADIALRRRWKSVSHATIHGKVS